MPVNLRACALAPPSPGRSVSASLGPSNRANTPARSRSITRCNAFNSSRTEPFRPHRVCYFTTNLIEFFSSFSITVNQKKIRRCDYCTSLPSGGEKKNEASRLSWPRLPLEAFFIPSFIIFHRQSMYFSFHLSRKIKMKK